MLFEVRIPDAQENTRTHLRTVEARDWFSALREALKQIGEEAPLRNVLCDLVEDGTYRVTEAEGGRVFEIQERQEPEEELDFAPATPIERKDISQTISDLNPVNQDALSQTITDFAFQIAKKTPKEDTEPTNEPATEINMPSFSAPDTIDFSQTMPSPPKKPLAETMQMDFAAIIDAQKQEERLPSSKKQPTTDNEEPSVIVSDEAYSREPLSPSETNRTIEEIKRIPSPSQLKSAPPAEPVDVLDELTGASGKYEPGKTTEMLADVFMRASEIHDFGTDKHAAAQFVLDLALGDVKAAGGGVLLTDINQPEKVLWFEAAKGLYAEQLLNLRVPLGQGIIGYMTQQGLHQIIPNIKDDPRYPNDILHSLAVTVESLLCAPIVNKDRIWGSIILYNTSGRRPFTQGELSIMTYLAHTTGEYLSSLV